jgi:glyoxylase-like metal-dependent hydrolase (beta-lactamase superfamily II)
MRYRWFVLVLLIVALVSALLGRRELLIEIASLTGSGAPPPLLDKSEEGASVRWQDDYFTVQEIVTQTFAIGEPRYAQQNYSYLIVGDERALLFDAGPGIRDIRQVAESLTDKPIIFLPSHFHYDHVGNLITFDEVAVVDLPYLRDRAKGNRLTIGRYEYLGMLEGFAAPTLDVDHWLPVGSKIDLGQRSLTLLHTPGHTHESISLWDNDRGILFSGDYLYPAELYAFLPNSRMADYLTTSRSLISSLPDNVVFFGAHRSAPPGAPQLTFGDLLDLNQGLKNIRNRTTTGEGFYPQVFPINERMVILAEPRWLQDWD